MSDRNQPGRHDLTMRALTSLQQEVVDAIDQWWNEKHYGPGLQDIADRLTISKSAARNYIETLCQRGVLMRTPRIARSIRVSDLYKSKLAKIPNP